MKSKYRIIVFTLFAALWSDGAAATELESAYQVGRISARYTDEERSRPLLIEFWYPTTDSFDEPIVESKEPEIFRSVPSIENASVADGRFPLLVFSHGTGGGRYSQAWLIERVVKAGYVAVSVDHFGNTHDNKIPREFLKWWERAIDVQFVLSAVLGDGRFAAHIDADRIGGVGHSLGGYTQIALAGGQVDRLAPGVPKKLPPEFPKTDEKIDYATDAELNASFAKYNERVKDERLRAFFVMAPAIGFGFYQPEQTAAIDAPIFIVSGKGDKETPIKKNALVYDRLISSSQVHLFGKRVGHYVFLGEATKFGRKVAPFVCKDHRSVDRAEIHEQTTELMLAFFAEHLN